MKFSLNELEYNIQDEMNPLLMKYIKDIDTLKATRVSSEKLAAPWSGNENDWFVVALRLKRDDSYIGLVCIRYESIKDSIVEIGWRLREDYHGQGYATEAANRVVRYIRDNLNANKVMAYCDNANKESINIMTKIGMIREGLMLKHFRINNTWRDEGIYALSMNK